MAPLKQGTLVGCHNVTTNRDIFRGIFLYSLTQVYMKSMIFGIVVSLDGSMF